MIKSLRRIGRLLLSRKFSSEHYWRERYSEGGNSGPGSYNHLAEFKARILNSFIADQGISTVVEFGCGDGNQLRLANYQHYQGYDVSSDAIRNCRTLFVDDSSKRFGLLTSYDGTQAEVALSLDVIFHLVEDSVFEQYMRRLFDSATRYVVIYSSNTSEGAGSEAPHVKHRNFTDWVAINAKAWTLIDRVENDFPYNGDYKSTTFSDFYFFSRVASET